MDNANGWDIDWSSSPVAAYVFADDFHGKASVEVTDGEFTDGQSTEMDVLNVPPTVEAGPDQTVNRGDTVSLAPATFNDKGTLDTHIAKIDWGDGSPHEPGLVTESPVGPPGSTAGADGTVDGSHVYGLEDVYTVKVCVTDDDTGTGCDTLTVTVLNRPPDCSGAVASIAEIWPPNHRWVDINVVGITDPEGDDVTITIDSIWQDEPVDTYGDGNFTPDGQGVGTSTASVRAERSGTKKVPGDGRFYHIGFTADDGHGGACPIGTTVKVVVPHDQSKGKNASDPIDGGPLYDSTALSP